jgi:dolichyl-diphosphooligosaccharide--protein glycosyltransferase
MSNSPLSRLQSAGGTAFNRMTDSIVYQLVKEWYDMLVLFIAAGIMFGTRLMTHEDVFTESGVIFTNTEAWYDYRHAEYVANNWPNVLQYDPYIDYPVGSSTGGDIFDFIIGTIAYIIDMGSVNADTVGIALVVFTVGFAVLSLIPLYFIAGSLFGRISATFSVLIFALLPSEFFSQSVLGTAGSHTLEVFLLLVGFYGILRTFSDTKNRVLTLEIFTTRDFGFFKPTAKWFVLATVPLTLLTTLNADIVALTLFSFIGFITIYTIFTTIAKSVSESVLISISFIWVLPTLMLAVTYFTTPEVTSLQEVSLGLSSLLVVLSLIYAIFSRYFETSRFLGTAQYQTSIMVLLTTGSIAGLGYINDTVSNVVLTAFNQVYSGNSEFLLLQSPQYASLADSYGTVFNGIFEQYGAIPIAGILGGLFLLAVLYTRLRNKQIISGELAIISLTIVFASASITQVWYNVFLTPFISIISGYGIYKLIEVLEINSTPIKQFKGFQYIGVLFIILLLVPAIAYPVSGTVFASDTAEQDDGFKYEETGTWLQENTANPGNYNTDPVGIDNAEYGVVNHWRNGYALSYLSQRPVVSSPDEQTTVGTSAYLLSNPDQTNPADQFTKYSDVSSEEFNDRYVVLDWRTVASESQFRELAYTHPTASPQDYTTSIYTQRGQYGFSLHSDAYYDSLAVRLYKYHGSSYPQQPLVVQTEATEQGFMSTPGDIRRQESIQKFESMDEAESFIQENGGQIGGVGIAPTKDVSHVENYRLVHVSSNRSVDDSEYTQLVRQMATFSENLEFSDLILDPSYTKTFEKVEGAEIQGENAYPNSEVIVALELNNPESETPIVFQARTTADEDGNFSVTVPYSTQGYDNYGPEEGYGNVKIKASGPYTVYSQVDSDKQMPLKVAETHVSEGKVLGEDDEPVEVTVEEIGVPQVTQDGSSSSGETSE